MHNLALRHVAQRNQHLLAICEHQQSLKICPKSPESSQARSRIGCGLTGAHRSDIDPHSLPVLLDDVAEICIVLFKHEAQVALVLEVVQQLDDVLLVLRIRR